MKVNILYVAGMILIFCLIGTVSAVSGETTRAHNELNLPENVVEVSPGVFYLGKAIDKGEVVEGYAFLHYMKPTTSTKPVWDDSVDIYKFMFGGIKWNETMQYEVNTTGSGLTNNAVLYTLNASLETWDSNTSFELFNDSLLTTKEGFNSSDRINRVTWDDLGSSGIIAANYFWFNPATKEMIESDVRFNTYYTWGDCLNFETQCHDNKTMDLQNLATHEFGHNGLNDLYMAKSVELTMYGYGDFGETHARTLGTGDISGIQALYG
jgi:hypothetical protein